MNMEIDKLSEELKFNIEYWLENPAGIINDQTEFWIRNNKEGKSFTENQLHEITEFVKKLTLEYLNYIEKNDFTNLNSEIDRVTEIIKEKIIEYNSLEKKFIRNAYLNLQTIFSNSYRIQSVLHRLGESNYAEGLELMYKFGQLSSELDFVTGQRAATQENAISGASAKYKNIAEFNSAVSDFIKSENFDFQSNNDLFTYLAKQIIRLNEYLNKINSSYSAEYNKEADCILLVCPSKTTTIYYPKSDANSHAKLNKFR